MTESARASSSAPPDGSALSYEPVVESAGIAPEGAPAQLTQGLPGWIVVTAGTLVTVLVALAQALAENRIGTWTGVALVVVSMVGPAVTRSGDRSLPAMMPPLAFLAATLAAGQLLVDDAGSWRTGEMVMIAETLGTNAAWVVAATAAAVVVAASGHALDRRRRR